MKARTRVRWLRSRRARSQRPGACESNGLSSVWILHRASSRSGLADEWKLIRDQRKACKSRQRGEASRLEGSELGIVWQPSCRLRSHINRPIPRANCRVHLTAAHFFRARHVCKDNNASPHPATAVDLKGVLYYHRHAVSAIPCDTRYHITTCHLHFGRYNHKRTPFFQHPFSLSVK